MLDTLKVKHVCPHGHVFHANMTLNCSGELKYANFSNNLCTVAACDSVSRIAEDTKIFSQNANIKDSITR